MVRRNTPVIKWDTPPDIVHPAPLQQLVHLSPTCDDPLAVGSFRLSHAHGDILRAGKHLLCCRYLPRDNVNFYSADLGVYVTVLPGQVSVDEEVQVVCFCVTSIFFYLNAI